MLVLALDTAADRAAAALTDFRKLQTSSIESMQRGHAEKLIPMVEGLLRESGRELPDVDRIAVTIGPGSFTGIRIALSVARGLALVIDKPVIGIGSLAALAASVSERSDGTILAVIDARRGEVFAALHDRDGRELITPFAGTPEEIFNRIGAMPAVMVGSGAEIMAHHATMTGRRVPMRSAITHPDPFAIARLAAALRPDEAPASPLYIRPPDARPQSSQLTPDVTPVAGAVE